VYIKHQCSLCFDFQEFREAEDPNFAELVHDKSLAIKHHDSFPTVISPGIQWPEATNGSNSRHSLMYMFL